MRIGIVNDMPLAVEALRRAIIVDGRHTVAWIARDGAEAVEKCAADTPDLVLMDLIMPVMDGVEATRRIMEATPCAILVVTATVSGNATRVYEALGAGALDAVETPAMGQGAAMLMVKLDMLAKRIAGPCPVSATATPVATAPIASGDAAAPAAGCLIAMGASAGGPAALATVLGELPADFPAAIVIVQHIDAAFAPGLISWLGGQCRLPVAAVLGGERPAPGRVYLGAHDKHVVIDAARRLALTDEPAGGIYLPSIDVLFHSMAVHWKRAGAGVLLTGMGRDGARGLLEVRKAGFATLAQDRATASVYGMPKAAAELGAASQVLPLGVIASQLVRIARDATASSAD